MIRDMKLQITLSSQDLHQAVVTHLRFLGFDALATDVSFSVVQNDIAHSVLGSASVREIRVIDDATRAKLLKLDRNEG
jgi:hypothetical protein